MTAIPVAAIEILVPYFGRRDFAVESVRSVLAQTDPAWTLHIVQDGDQPADLSGWIRGLADDRITYSTNAGGLGLPGNFQRCLDVALGTHVVFLGCDDALDPGYVKAVRTALAHHPGAAAVHPGVRVIDTAGNGASTTADRMKRFLSPTSDTVQKLSGEDLLVSLLRGNWAYFPAFCWNRARIAELGFRQDLAVTLDLDLLAGVILQGGEIVVLPDVQFRYRRHPASASSVTLLGLERFAEEAELFDELRARCRAAGWNRAARAARWHVSSRLHAAAVVPRALATGNVTGAARLVRHLVAP